MFQRVNRLDQTFIEKCLDPARRERVIREERSLRDQSLVMSLFTATLVCVGLIGVFFEGASIRPSTFTLTYTSLLLFVVFSSLVARTTHNLRVAHLAASLAERGRGAGESPGTTQAG